MEIGRNWEREWVVLNWQVDAGALQSVDCSVNILVIRCEADDVKQSAA